MEKISFEELTNISSKFRNDKKNDFSERIKSAIIDVINHITHNCYDEMKKNAEKGNFSYTLYTFYWTENKDDIFDKNGVQTVFGENVRLLDIVTKSKNDFIKELNSFFNNDDSSKYRCGISRDIKNKSWNIYVSWGIIRQKPLKKNNVKNFNKI